MYKRPAQILVFTVLILLVISLAVVSITGTTARNSRQVFNNLEYEKSYNYAEAETISAINTLSNPDLDIGDLTVNGVGDLECKQGSDKKVVCSKDADEGTRRIVLTIFDTNLVENYDLAVGDYFDVILSEGDGSSSYQGSLNFKWVGETAFDISLIYEDTQGKLHTAKQLLDPGSVYTSTGPGFLNPAPAINENQVTINLQDVNKTNVPNGSKYKYLRLKSVSRNFGTSITIRPEATGSLNLPNQVRRIEAFSYLTETASSAAPVVLTQLPLSPQVPAPLTYAQNVNATRQPFCGNGLVEGSEACDDGNANDADSCPNTCSCSLDGQGTLFKTQHWGDNGRRCDMAYAVYVNLNASCVGTQYAQILLRASADNALCVQINGTNLGPHCDAASYRCEDLENIQDYAIVYPYDLRPYIKPGNNTIGLFAFNAELPSGLGYELYGSAK
jgi:cysteine-rich repeat protein